MAICPFLRGEWAHIIINGHKIIRSRLYVERCALAKQYKRINLEISSVKDRAKSRKEAYSLVRINRWKIMSGLILGWHARVEKVDNRRVMVGGWNQSDVTAAETRGDVKVVWKGPLQRNLWFCQVVQTVEVIQWEQFQKGRMLQPEQIRWWAG